MGIKNKRSKPTDPRPCFNPYRLNPDDDMGVCYARYLADPTRIMRFGGRTYYKIFDCLPFDLSDRRGVLVWMTAEMPFTSGDVLMDENGNRFAARIEMIYCRLPGLPNHSRGIYPLLLTGDTGKLGEYLARM